MFNFKKIPNLKRLYNSIDDNLMADLITPVLTKAIRYDRAVGFFSSAWMKEVAEGLAVFAQRGGQARIVTSIKLSKKDREAIQNGLLSDAEIQELIDKQIFETISDLQKSIEINTLATLSWMIAQNILVFRFAIPIGKLTGGMFHTKSSIFYDEFGNGIAVFGSQNDSHQATLNEETLCVWNSWDSGVEYFKDLESKFDIEWNGNNTTLKTYSLSDSAKAKIIDAGKNYTCPYIRKVDPGINKCNSNIKDIELRPYQQQAINAWRDNDYIGLFEMATGSGKTITSILAVQELVKDKRRLCIVVSVPYIHLVTQWKDELENFGFSPILCFGSSRAWEINAYAELNKYKAKLIDNVCFVVTHTTASLPNFSRFIDTFQDIEWLLIGDEVHGLGSEKQSVSLFPSAKYRIGLSATPKRWFDDEGTQRLYDYFKKTVVEYGLANAIEDKALTPYEYEPVLIELLEEEVAKFEDLSKKIGILMLKKNKTEQDQKKLEMYCRERAGVIGKASNKLPALIELVKKHKQAILDSGERYIHNLFYCAPGEHKEVLKALNEAGIKVHEFVHSVDLLTRTKVLKAFADGDIEGIVAVKCLDEGVDVPATKRAYVLASSTNPREFVQRRGRVLRKSPQTGKTIAYIYDFMIGPWSINGYSNSTAQALLRRELPRFSEFNSLNLNKYKVQDEIKDVCSYFNIFNEIDMPPWDIYDMIVKNNVADIA